MNHLLPLPPATPPPAAGRSSRREFLHRTGAAAALGAATALLPRSLLAATTPPAPPPSLVGSNVVAWMHYAEREKRTLDLAEVMTALRDCGYDYLEGRMNVEQPEENARFAGRMHAHGLRPFSIYAGAVLHETTVAGPTVDGLLAAARVCAREGFRVLVCNAKPIPREKTDQELATQAAAFTRLGTGLNELGMRLAVHDHLPGLASGARELRHNFQHTAPDAVGFCYDVAWLSRGGLPPQEALPAYGSRLVTWHLRQIRNGVWREDLDEGDIDYGWIAGYVARQGLPRHFEVELALEPGTVVTRGVVENHRRSREFVRRIFGV
jgi:sugar phosphate isomerase/epimerase